MTFDKQWFKNHQRTLLWLCNTPVISAVFRRILCINGERSSVGKRKIARILPNEITWATGKKNEYQSEYRTHDKYAKRLYYAFKPLWYAIHYWDILVANPVKPAWNLGFDSLTAYPAAGSNSPVDGRVFRSVTAETFSTIRAGAGTGASDTDSDDRMAQLASHASTSNNYYVLVRSIFCFDSSSLTASANISNDVFSLYGNDKTNGNGSTTADVVAATPAATNTLATSDYAQLGTTVFASKAYVDWSTAGYNDFTLDANGINNTNKTGVSKFGFRLGWDTLNSFDGSWVGSAETRFGGKFADQTGTSNDPKLVVTYTLGSNVGGAFLFNFV